MAVMAPWPQAQAVAQRRRPVAKSLRRAAAGRPPGEALSRQGTEAASRSAQAGAGLWSKTAAVTASPVRVGARWGAPKLAAGVLRSRLAAQPGERVGVPWPWLAILAVVKAGQSSGWEAAGWEALHARRTEICSCFFKPDNISLLERLEMPMHYGRRICTEDAWVNLCMCAGVPGRGGGPAMDDSLVTVKLYAVASPDSMPGSNKCTRSDRFACGVYCLHRNKTVCQRLQQRRRGVFGC